MTTTSPTSEIEAYLGQAGVPFTIRHHPTVYTALDVARAERIPGRSVAKVVMVFADGALTMLVLDAGHHLDMDKVRAVLNVTESRLADEREFAGAFPDAEVGAMPPFGNRQGLPVYVDAALAEQETIVCQAGTHQATVALRYRDFARLVQPVVAEIRRRPQQTILRLDPNESRLLTTVLRHELRELRTEIANTDNSTFKQSLRENREVVERLLHGLNES